MGEYADAYIDSMIDSWSWSPRRRRRIRQAQKPVACNRCGREGLNWYEGHLFEGNALHKCHEVDLHRVAADDFDVLP